jgi:gliding motility-associated-like protein
MLNILTGKRYMYLLFLLYSLSGYAQTYNMPNSSVSTCSGNFYDRGGVGGNTGNNQNFVFTICPSTPGSSVRVTFSSFDLDDGFDFLEIFDGNSIAAPPLGAGIYTGVAGPGIVQASVSNPTGCLTFRFTSDFLFTRPGWAAVISCIAPCQTITANINSTVPAAQGDGIIRICQGGSVQFNGSGTFSSSGAGAIYTWHFGDGTSATGTTVNKTYAVAGSYTTRLVITDPAGCVNNTSTTQEVQVSTTPVLTSTAAPNPICLGATATLGATVTPTQYVPNCTPPVSGTTFLPDGSGVSYTTAIPVSCFAAGQTITAGSQIQNICLNMEHSYLGDLNIVIICPNGQQTVLHAYDPLGSVTSQNLGTPWATAPIDGSSGTITPGIGANYCFTASAATNLVGGTLTGGVFTNGNGPGTYTDTYIPAGSYLPAQSYNNLIGCPANGNWTIQVTDNLASDNGYIFNWDINFAPSLIPANGVFTPTIASQGWQAATGLTNTGPTSANVIPTATGSNCYTYSVTDNFGCTYTRNQCITVNPLPTATISPASATICSGQTTTLTASGGTTYIWSTGATTAAISVSPGSNTTYTVTVTNANSCTATTSSAVTVSGGVSTATTQTNPLCFGAGTGSIDLTPSGGTSPYTYIWSTGATSQDLNNIPANTYIVTVSDNGSCTTTATVTITQPSAVTASIASSTNALCSSAATGSATAAGAGGTGAHSFVWSNGPVIAANPNLLAGTYIVTVTDANSCTATTSVTITQPTAVTASIAAFSNVLCNGSATGSATAAGAGGAGGFSYIWSNGPAIATNTGLPIGVYTVTATDANNCSTTTNVTITEPTAVTITVDNVTNTACNGSTGAINISVAGGTGSYTYNWSNTGTTQDISGLAINFYTVTVTDGNACTSTNTATVNNIASATVSLTSSNLTCNGSADGCVIANVTGNVGGVSYLWSNGATVDSICGLAAGTYTLTVTDTISSGSGGGQVNLYSQAFDGITHDWTLNISTGVNGADNNFWTVNSNEAGMPVGTCGAGGGPNKTLHITSVFNPNGGAAYDAGGLCGFLFCPETNMRAESPSFSTVGQSNLTLKFNYISLGDALLDNASVVYSTNGGGVWQVLNPSIKSLSCPSTQGRWTAFTATLPASCNNNPNVKVGINWTNNDDGFGTDPSVAIDSVVVFAMSASSLQVCTVIADTIITEPAVIAITVDSTANINCNSGNNGFVAVSSVGGTGTHTYMWSNSTSTTASATGLTANVYTVTVTDANNCVMTQTVTITEPSLLASMVDSTVSPTCNGTADGGIYITAVGGTLGYVFDWGAGVTTEDLTAISSGNYSVTITDANGCMTTIDTSITQPGAVSVAIDSSTNISCNGLSDGIAYASGFSGIPGYTFVWNDAGAQTSPTATGLAAGTYIVTISDQNGCTDTISVVISAPSFVTATVPSNTTVSCAGGNDGTATAAGAGGTGSGYTFVWDAGGQTTPTATGLMANTTYNVTVSDANGCSATSSIAITEATPVTATIPSNTTVSCGGGSDGTATAAGAGGTGSGYTFVWDSNASGQVTATATGLMANTTYIVTVTDANGCAATASITITEPSAVTATASPTTAVSCAGGNNGTAIAVGAGGAGGYTFVWSAGGQVTATATGLAANTTYTVTVTDALGCATTTNVSVSEPSAVTASIPISSSVNCFGGNDGEAIASGAGGVGSYTYQWDAAGQTTATVTGLMANTTYTVTVTDANACTATATIMVSEPSALTITPTIVDILCNTANNSGSITANMGGGTPPYNTYVWDSNAGGQTTATATGLTAGTYTVTVTDDNVCTTTATFTVAPMVPLDSATVPLTVVTGVLDCQLNPVGALSIVPVSGTGYTYLWSNGDADSTATNLGAGTYTVTITNSSNCMVTATGTVIAPFVPNVNPFVSVTGSSSVTVTTDDIVDIDGGNDESGLGVSYIWTASSTDITIGNNTNHSTTAVSGVAGTYTLSITATSGTAPNCTDAGTVTITYESSFVGMPNAFTPGNGDNTNTNEIFRPVGLNATEVEVFKVFNRWGQLLYDGSDLQGTGWDGTYMGVEQPSEIYLYLLQYKLGATESVIVRGEFTLIR